MREHKNQSSHEAVTETDATAGVGRRSKFGAAAEGWDA